MALGDRAKGILDLLLDPSKYDDRFEVRNIPKVKPRDQYFEPVVEPYQPNLVVPEVKLSDLEGRPYLSTMSDRTSAEGILTGIGDKELAYPINLTGGQDFMAQNPEMWASAPNPVSNMIASGRDLKRKYGTDPVFMPWRMSPSGSDFAGEMTAGAMMSYAAKNMPKADKKALDKRIKEFVPDFVGVDSPAAPAQIQSQPDKMRKFIQQQIMDKDFRDRGSISLPQARIAIADQTQLNAPELGFQNVGIMDVDAGALTGRGNRTYPDAVGGEFLGRLNTDARLLDLAPTNVYPAKSKDAAYGRSILEDEFGNVRDLDTSKGYGAARRSAEINPYGGLIDEKLLRSLEKKGFNISALAGAGVLGGMAATQSEDVEANPAQVVKNLTNLRGKGYDTDNVFYHGTPMGIDFTEFDYKYAGKGNDQFGAGFYLTNSPSQASGYAGQRIEGQSSTVIPTFTKNANLLEVDGTKAGNLGDVLNLDYEQTKKILEKSKALKRGVDDEDMNPFGDRYESFWDEGPEDWMYDQLARDQAGRDPDELAAFFEDDMESYLKALSDVTGYDGLAINFGDGVTNQVHWNAQNIRSVNAKGEKSNTANLLASVGGAGLLGAGLTQSEDAEASFLGEVSKLGASRSDLKGMAEKMLSEGVDPQLIWKNTGWEFNVGDGKWRTELPNTETKINLPTERIPDRRYAIEEFLDDPELLSQYDLGAQFLENDINLDDPFDSLYGSRRRSPLSNVQVVFNPDIEAGGAAYNSFTDTIEMPVNVAAPKEDRGAFLHELQHAIQEREGFSTGSSPDRMQKLSNMTNSFNLLTGDGVPRGEAAINKLNDKIAAGNASLQDYENLASLKEVRDKALKYTSQSQNQTLSPFSVYGNTIGEVEANNVMARDQYNLANRDKSPENTEFMNTQNYQPRGQQILNRGSQDDYDLGIYSSPNLGDDIAQSNLDITTGYRKAIAPKKAEAARQYLKNPIGRAADVSSEAFARGVEGAAKMAVGAIGSVFAPDSKAYETVTSSDSIFGDPSSDYEKAAKAVSGALEEYLLPAITEAVSFESDIGSISSNAVKVLTPVIEAYQSAPAWFKSEIGERVGYGALAAMSIWGLTDFGLKSKAKDIDVSDLFSPKAIESQQDKPTGLLGGM